MPTGPAAGVQLNISKNSINEGWDGSSPAFRPVGNTAGMRSSSIISRPNLDNVGRASYKRSSASGKRAVKKSQKELDKIDKLALPPKKVKPKVIKPTNDESFDSEASGKKKRGRKTAATDKYVAESEAKINSWKQTLKDGKWPDTKAGPGKPITEDDIAKLKNQISAQRSRANKKMEVKALEDQLKALADQTRKVLKAINEEVPDDLKQKIVDNIYQEASSKPDITVR